MSAETQAERTRAAIEQTLAAHRINYHSHNVGGQTADSLRYTSCDGCDWLGGWHDESGWEQHQADEVARALAEQAQTTDTLTNDERTALGRLLMRDHGCIHHHGPNAEWSPCRACDRRLDLVDHFLAARQAGDRDAHHALARVRELEEMLREAVGFEIEADHPCHLDHNGDCQEHGYFGGPCLIPRARRALGHANDQHDRSGT